MLSISKTRPRQVTIEGRNIDFKNEIKVLGLTLKRTGAVNHLTNRINHAKAQTSKLRRFNELDSYIKLRLYKSLIRPVIEYPIIPNALASNSKLLKMQRVQDRNIRLITSNNEDLRA